MKVIILSGLYRGEIDNLVEEDGYLWIWFSINGVHRDINARLVEYEFIVV
jgi:hypothetical protein